MSTYLDKIAEQLEEIQELKLQLRDAQGRAASSELIQYRLELELKETKARVEALRERLSVRDREVKAIRAARVSELKEVAALWKARANERLRANEQVQKELKLAKSKLRKTGTALRIVLSKIPAERRNVGWYKQALRLVASKRRM